MDVSGKLTMNDEGCEIASRLHQKDHAQRITMQHKNFNVHTFVVEHYDYFNPYITLICGVT